MIKITFEFGGSNQEVVIKGNELLFYDVGSGMVTPLAGLKFDKHFCKKQFPEIDYEDGEWKKEVVKRFKEHLKKFKTEMEKMNYVVSELKNQGYIPLFYQRGGFRPKKFK